MADYKRFDVYFRFKENSKWTVPPFTIISDLYPNIHTLVFKLDDLDGRQKALRLKMKPIILSEYGALKPKIKLTHHLSVGIVKLYLHMLNKNKKIYLKTTYKLYNQHNMKHHFKITNNAMFRPTIYTKASTNIAIRFSLASTPVVGIYRTLGELDPFSLGALDPRTLGDLDFKIY